MNELLKLSNNELINNIRVRRAHYALTRGHVWKRPPIIYVNIYQAAFEMRDAVCKTSLGLAKWLECLIEIMGILGGNNVALRAKPNHWIIAATMCWEENQQ